jgi:hypothetical protein
VPASDPTAFPLVTFLGEPVVAPVLDEIALRARIGETVALDPIRVHGRASGRDLLVLHRIDEKESAAAHSTVFPGATGGLHEVFVPVFLEEPLRVWVRESVLLYIIGVNDC